MNMNEYGCEEYRVNDDLHREDGPAFVNLNGDRYWYKHGNLHRKNGPAIELANGEKYWYEQGLKHREDGPAVTYPGGAAEWWLNDKQVSRTDMPEIDENGNKWWGYNMGDFFHTHRKNDLPAIEWANGDKEWWIGGKRHRVGKPAVITLLGNKTWWRHGKLHREDGPACEFTNGSKEWYINGKRHRGDGPAIIWSFGVTSYWLNGYHVPKLIFKAYQKLKAYFK